MGDQIHQQIYHEVHHEIRVARQMREQEIVHAPPVHREAIFQPLQPHEKGPTSIPWATKLHCRLVLDR